MDTSILEIRQTGDKGRGLFATVPIARGAEVLVFQGWVARTESLQDAWLALQVGPDEWLCSHGDLVDDCANHSCTPNTGFLTGEPVLHALRDIAPGEEIVWDYSTSISFPGWTLACRCGTPACRKIIRPFPELTAGARERLMPMALRYLREERE